jgi:hypothetical protein
MCLTSPSRHAGLTDLTVAFGKFMHVLLGLYMYAYLAFSASPIHPARSWEWFTSLGFDWDFISGKKKFRWPMVGFRSPLCVVRALILSAGVLFLKSILPVIRVDWNVRPHCLVVDQRPDRINGSAIALNVTTYVLRNYRDVMLKNNPQRDRLSGLVHL